MIKARVPRRVVFSISFVFHSAEVALPTSAVDASGKDAVDHLVVPDTEMLELLANLPISVNQGIYDHGRITNFR